MAEDTVSHKIREFGNWIRFENKTKTRYCVFPIIKSVLMS